MGWPNEVSGRSWIEIPPSQTDESKNVHVFLPWLAFNFTTMKVQAGGATSLLLCFMENSNCNINKISSIKLYPICIFILA